MIRRINTSTLFAFFILAAIALTVHFQILRFGLTSDHLQAIYEWRSRFIVPNRAAFMAFINPYGVSAVMDKIIDWVWGFNPLPYFAIALITKVISAFTLYKLSQYLFKSSLIAFVTGLSALVLFAGIQSAVPGATIYISLAFFCLGFLNLFKLYDQKYLGIPTRESAIIALTFILSFLATPIRMYGLIPLLVLAEVSALLLRKTNFKGVTFRLGVFFILFLYLKRIGLVDSYGTAAGVADTVTSVAFYQRFSNLPGQVVFMLGAYRQVFIPDVVVDLIGRSGYILGLTSSVVYLLGLVPGFIMFFVLRSQKSFPRVWPVISLFLHSLLVVSIMLFLRKITILSQLDSFLGGVIANILLSGLVYLWATRHRMAISATVFFGTPVLFMAVAYVLYPLEPQDTLSRYFGASSFFASIIIGYLLFLVLTSRLLVRVIGFSVISGLLFYNAALIHNYYVNAGEDGTYQHYLDSVFQAMNSEIRSRPKNSRPLVYIRGDNYNFISTTILNQGRLRFSLVNDDLSETAQPHFVTDLEVLKNIYSGKIAPELTDIDAVYGFEIKDKKAHSITSWTREYLKKEVR